MQLFNPPLKRDTMLFVMDIEALTPKYKGKVTFWGEIDRRLVAFGTPEEVREAVMRVRRVLDDGTGGVVAQCEWEKFNPTENIEMVLRAWIEPLQN